MLRLACFFLVAATLIGALMPSSPKSVATANDDGIIYTPQSSGSSYRVANDDSPSSRTMSRGSGGSLRLPRQADGHFYLDAQVNGGIVHFLVDTGASGIALTRADARTAGLALSGGTDRVGEGASGSVLGQWVTLDRFEVGDRTLEDVQAVVIEGGSQSLLGQDVLRGFDIEVHGDEMVLR